MTRSHGPFSPPAGARRSLRRRPILAAVAIAVVLGSLLLAAAPAGAFISGEFGLQRRKPVLFRNGPLQYHSGRLIHASDSYAIYWDPLELYNSEWMRLIDQYFHDVGAASGELGNIFSLNAQYGETGYSTNPAAPASAKEAHAAGQSTFRGAYTVTDPYPPEGENCKQRSNVVCLTDQSIRAELQKVIKSGVLPGSTGTVPGAKSTPVYYILTPPGVTVCAGPESPNACSNSTQLELEAREIKEAKVTHPAETGICGYHSAINPSGPAPIVYAVQPWIAGDAGLFVESVSPLITSVPTSDVLACQDNSALQEPNQPSGLNPFAAYGGGLADVIVGGLANEQSNIVVDPLLNGWYQNAPAGEHGSPEQGDMCQWNFGPPISSPASETTHAGSASNEKLGSGSYYLHWAFNSSGFITGKNTVGCWQGTDLGPRITVPNPVNVGDVVSLDANESGIALAPAPLGPRQQKEEVRLANEVRAVEKGATGLGGEIISLEAKIAGLGSEITRLQNEVTKFGEELIQLEKEEARVTANEANLAKERQQAEEEKLLTSKKEEEFAATGKRLAEERKRIAEAKVAAKNSIATDGARRIAAENEKRAAEERKAVAEEDVVVVTEDKALAKEEEKLAEEHRLISEREPFIAPIYKWDFGYKEKGKEVTEEGEEKASVFHSFPCAGTYTLTLSVVDGGGYQADLQENVTQTITVEGKPCEEPSPPPPGAGAGAGSGSGSGVAGGSATVAAPAKPTVPGPVATQSVLSSSLSRAMSRGLVVRYSVSQQASGHFEVLLAASIAHRVGLHPPLASGLPAGTPPQVVIAKALLVTTRAGRGTLKLQFGKVTARRLRRLHNVPLLLRLNVRNAGGGTTTVLSTLTLH